MKSEVLPSFWRCYHALDQGTRTQARKTFRLWIENPFHPSLHFKCIHAEERIWSVRVSRAVRAVGVLDGNLVTWFWIGNHDEYERFFS